MVSSENMTSDGTATFFAMVDEEKIPRVEKVANLLISVSSKGGKQYIPMTANVTVQNTGTVSISNVFLRFIPEEDTEILSGGEMFIREIKPGEKKTFEVKLLPHRSGNLTLGYVEATAVAPFELACGGYTVLKFRSNDLQVSVKPSRISYELDIKAPRDVPIHNPFSIEIRVTNTGDVSVPANLTVILPEGVAITPNEKFSFKGGIIIAPISLQPGENGTFVLEVYPYTNGTKEFTFHVKTPLGVVASTVIHLNVTVPRENETTPTLTETSTVHIRSTVTVTETHTITETQTIKTTTISVQTVPYIPASAKIMWGFWALSLVPL